MKKALLGAALLIAPFFSLANIYDNASNPVPQPESKQCMYQGVDITMYASQAYAEWKTTKGQSIGEISSEDVEMRHDYNGPGQCKYKFYKSHYNRIQKSTGEWIEDGRYQSFNFNQTGPYEITYACDPTSEHFITGTRTGQSEPMCFTPQSLADADTCEEKDADGLYESFISSESSVSCMEKPEDGSICPVKKNFEITSNATGNTSYFYEYDTNSDPTSCYTQNAVELTQPTTLEKDNTFPSNVGDCSESNGIAMCNENPINVCDQSGNCQKGCGSIAFGGQQEFVCLSGDIDNDGIPDYQDRDKDGDGIKNEDDLDSDGDGIEDPINNTPNNLRSPHQSTLEQLLGQIAQNTSGGSGGGGSGSSASEIGESVAEEIEEKLVEQADFSGTEYEQSVNSKIEATDTAIDEFLQDDEKDLTNAFDESQFQSSFSTLKSALSPKGCSAQFAIPLTDSTLDLCEPASKAQPFLYVIFAIATFIYCMRRIQSTARSE